jgi:MFS family permease
MLASENKNKSRIRLFFMAHILSSVGDYVSYVALVILANNRFHSPTKLSFLLLAEFIPAIFLGAILGHIVDTTSRRLAAVASELLRVAAYVGLAVFSSYYLMLAMALMAGLGTALYKPSVNSGLANLASGKKLQTIFSWQSTINSSARVAGPLLAGVLISIWKPQLLLLANAVTFAISAFILSLLPFDNRNAEKHTSSQFSLKKLYSLPHNFKVLAVSAGVVALCAGAIGVAEVYFALKNLKLGNEGVAIILAAYGVGMITGNWVSRYFNDSQKGYLVGMFLLAVGLIVTSQMVDVVPAMLAFAVAGLGNGMVMVNARTLVVDFVEEKKRGVAYGTKDALESAGLVLSLLSDGFLVDKLGANGLFMLSGVGIGLTLIFTNIWFKSSKIIT